MGYTGKIFDQAQRHAPCMYWVSVAENGRLSTKSVAGANKTNNCYSVSKLFTVTALGMLVDEGKLSTEEKIVDIFSQELLPDMDKKWKDVTVDMVMRHSFGISHGFLDIDCEDMQSFDVRYGSKTDYLKNVFSVPLPRPLGTEYCYSDGAYYLLSRVVEKKSGEDLYEYLRKRLFLLMDFEETAWSKCPMGYSMGATGLYIRTPDIAKLGLLYLNKGMWNGKRILSEQWCDTVIQRGYELKGENGIYFKRGMLGQSVYVDTSRNLVVAWQGYEARPYQKQMLDFLQSL